MVSSSRFSGTRQQSAGRVQGDFEHGIGHRHLQIDAGLDGLLHDLQVAFLYVAAVFAQVNGDAVGAGALGGQRGRDGVRIARPPRLAQGGHVIDVDPQGDGLTHTLNSLANNSSSIKRVRRGRSPK